MDNFSDLTGKTIGKYQIVSQLGRGGMAEVYKAYQTNLDRHVALKLMHAFLVEDKDFIARFEREAKNVAALRHPNIVQVYDFDVINGMPYMVMEFIEGPSLKGYLEDLAHQGKALSLDEAIRIISEVGEALAYAHQRGMIHRDVKPANVMMDVTGRVILTDFGIAKIVTGPSYTATGATIGTPAYMSPEQGLGRAGDHRADIYSLGVMLYQLVTGQLPYDADTPLAVMLKHVNDPLPQPRSVKPDIPEGLERIILKSMAKNADERFATVNEMLAALKNIEAAANLTLPATSMAAGVSASAQTMAASPASTIAMTPATAQPAVETRVGTGTQSHTLVTATPTRRLPVPMYALVGGGLLVLVVIGGIALAASGALGGRATPTTSPPTSVVVENTQPGPTATTARGTPTPDVVQTQLAAIQATQAAFQFTATASPTPTLTETPDATQTALACTYDYAITAQDPADAKSLAVGSRPISKTVTLENTGTCTWPAGSVLVETNLPAAATPTVVDVVETAPNATVSLAFNWLSARSASTVSRTWELRLPDGRVIGAPLTFSFRYAVFATPTVTRPPATATSQASATPAVSGLTEVYPADYIGCVYQGVNLMDYNCTVRLGYAGGLGPFTLYYNGERIGLFQIGESMYYNIIGRRCFTASYNIRLVDDGTVSQISRDLFFDPANVASVFPGGQCTPLP